MKKSLIVICMAALTLPLLADSQPRRRTRPAGRSRPSGGIVEKTYEGNVLRILDTQKQVPFATVQALARQMRLASLLPFEATQGVLKGSCPMMDADNLVKAAGVGAGVVIVDDAKLPWMLVSPESKWTILNIAPIAADSPTPAKLEERFNKVLWCAVARTLGAGYSSYPGCVLTPFSTLRELDAIPVNRPCPEPFNKMIDTGAKFGINTITIASYRTACEKGWAPAPTNDVQKAIWDKVHAMPTQPIKIKPETRKVAE